MIDYQTAFILFVFALILGGISGAVFYKYSLREKIGFAVKLPDSKWHRFTVIRDRNHYKVLADGDLILSEKHVSKL